MTKIAIMDTDEATVYDVPVRNLAGAYPWEAYGDWAPAQGEEYYYIRSSGVVARRVWDEHTAVHHGRLYMGNVFKTSEDAEFALSKIMQLLSRVV